MFFVKINCNELISRIYKLVELMNSIYDIQRNEKVVNDIVNVLKKAKVDKKQYNNLVSLVEMFEYKKIVTDESLQLLYANIVKILNKEMVDVEKLSNSTVFFVEDSVSKINKLNEELVAVEKMIEKYTKENNKPQLINYKAKRNEIKNKIALENINEVVLVNTRANEGVAEYCAQNKKLNETIMEKSASVNADDIVKTVNETKSINAFVISQSDEINSLFEEEMEESLDIDEDCDVAIKKIKEKSEN